MLSYQSHNLKISVFCTILEEIPLKFPGLKISGIDQSIGLDKDCDQFAWGQLLWSPAFSDIIFLNESNLFTPTADFLFLTILQLYAPSKYCWHPLWQASTPQGKKTYTIFFTGQKFYLRLVIVQMLIMFLTCEKNYPTYQNLCSLLQIIFFSYLACSNSQYVYNAW